MSVNYENQLRMAAMAYADAVEPRYKERCAEKGAGTIVRLYRQAYAAFLKGAAWQADYRKSRTEAA